MIEILILYTIRKREKTIYSIRKEIIEIFGAYTKPSIGTVYPALKRLLNAGAIQVSEYFSDGGKKSSYYLITKKGLELFKELFFNNENENPSLFHTHLYVRFGIMGLLSQENRKRFIDETLKKIELFEIDIKSKLNDEFLELDYYQEQIMKKTLDEYKALVDYIKRLKVENDG